MATKAVNFKLDESMIGEVRSVAEAFDMTFTDVIREALTEYLEKMRSDPFYRLTANVREADAEESAEILAEIGNLTDDDLTITSAKRFTV